MERRLLTLGHSPDPDDAFMFYALTHRRIETGPYEFRHLLEDIETLNRRALRGELEVSAVSLHACAYLADRYALLRCGASVGRGYGPLVVARREMSREELRRARLGVPGTLTTAFLLARLWLGEFQEVVLPFDGIPEAVRRGEVEAGLLIHEGQLTYRDYGLRRLVDLGEWWEAETGLPLPLGVNVVRRDLGPEVMRSVARILRRSIEYALEHREEALRYAMEWGRGLDADRTDRFVSMYVNRYTLDMGPEGQRAVETLLERAHQAGLIPEKPSLLWVEEEGS